MWRDRGEGDLIHILGVVELETNEQLNPYAAGGYNVVNTNDAKNLKND